jgi:hypothetical protein
MILSRLAVTGSAGLVSLSLLATSVAPVPGFAQNRSAATSYCFVVKDALSVFASPAAAAATSDTFNTGDIAYATTNPPRTVQVGNRSFVEVAIYGGNRGWLPRTSTIDGVPLIVDLSPDQCSNPGPGAAGYGGGRSVVPSPSGQDNSTPYCFVVKDQVSVFSRPSPDAATADTFNTADIAYATTNPPRTVRAGNRSFVEVAIYGGNRGWLPRTSTIDGVPLLVDLTTNQCTRPGPGAAGHDSTF